MPPETNVNSSQLAAANSVEQKQMLGEVLYMRISPTQPELAGKITGMLLEMDNNELLHLLDSPDALNAKVNEALVVLHEYSSKGAEEIVAA
jgi:polyadenylate-binding protein